MLAPKGIAVENRHCDIDAMDGVKGRSHGKAGFTREIHSSGSHRARAVEQDVYGDVDTGGFGHTFPPG